MQKKVIRTRVGDIAVYLKNYNFRNKTPVIFLHGVYFDHSLWDEHAHSINDRLVITVDMPYHGESKNIIKPNWDLDDCAVMLLEILDTLKIKQVIAIGHSWGSMSIIRAAKIKPEAFESVILCNTPFKAPSNLRIVTILLQETALLISKSFYIKQAGKALFSKDSLIKNPKLLEKIIKPMSRLTIMQIMHTNKAVIINSKDSGGIFRELKVPALGVVGRSDYVGLPPLENIITVEGGHISPLEDSGAIKSILDSYIK